MDESHRHHHHYKCEPQHFHCPPPVAATAVTVQPYGSQSAAATQSSCGQSNQSLDTVRSLHQTVVSLRNALDDARREISTLKKQITVQTVIEEGKAFKEQDEGHKDIKEQQEDHRQQQPQHLEAASQKMGSQIDVKIRVSSNLNVSTGDAMEDGKASGGDSARSVVNIKLTSQERLDVSQREDCLYSFNQATNEEVVLETKEPEGVETAAIEEASQEALVEEEEQEDASEGDNSVFDDSKGEVQAEGLLEEKKISKNVLHIPHQKLTRAHSDTQEEVDDIELIFHSDDARELHEEEMVSISATYEPWQKPGSSGTPVLLSFEKFSLDDERSFSGGNRKQCSLDESSETTKNRDTHLFKKSSLDRSIEEEMKPSLGHSKWQTQKQELHVTDISKCGISEENIMDMGRRNTCPNPPVYRPILTYQRDSCMAPPATRHRSSLTGNRCVLGTKFNRPGFFARSGGGTAGGFSMVSPARGGGLRGPLIAITNAGGATETTATNAAVQGPKRSSSVQTDISALPDHWQSESHLAGGGYGNGLFTLPSKFNPLQTSGRNCPRVPLRPSQKTQEARRVLLSDINFTSMIPELSRSADHLCPDGEEDGETNPQQPHEEEDGGEDVEGVQHQHNFHRMHLGHHHLQAPHSSSCRKGLTPSASVNSHGSMNENSFATQTTQTQGDYWVQKGDSFDSASCYTNDSRLSLNRNCRSRSVPSIKCVYCRRALGGGMRTSESMHYTPRVMAIPESYGTVKGSLPDLRHDCCCPRRYQGRFHGQSVGSTESLVDDSDVFIRRSTNNVTTTSHVDYSLTANRGSTPGMLAIAQQQHRRCSENDIGRSYTPSKQNLPFLPKSASCLKIGHLAKVIARNGRVVVGQVRYVGPICNAEYVAKLDGGSHDTFIGLELPSNGGDTDGTIEGKRFFYCEQNRGIFVPFPKVIMAWTS